MDSDGVLWIESVGFGYHFFSSVSSQQDLSACWRDVLDTAWETYGHTALIIFWICISINDESNI